MPILNTTCSFKRCERPTHTVYMDGTAPVLETSTYGSVNACKYHVKSCDRAYKAYSKNPRSKIIRKVRERIRGRG